MDTWGDRFEEYGSNLFESMGYNYYNSQDLENEKNVTNSDVDGLIVNGNTKPSLLIKPSLLSRYPKICFEFKSGGKGETLRKKMLDDDEDIPQRTNHSMHQIVRNAVDFIKERNISRKIAYVIVVDSQVKKENDESLYHNLSLNVEENELFSEEDVEIVENQVDTYLIDAGRLSMYLNKQNISLMLTNNLGNKDPIDREDIQERLLPKIESEDLQDLVGQDNRIEDYKDRGNYEYVEDTSFILSRGSMKTDPGHMALTLDVIIDKDKMLERQDFENIITKVKNYLVYFFINHQFARIQARNMSFQLNLGIHFASANYSSFSDLREDLTDILADKLKGTHNSDLIETYENVLEDLAHENENYNWESLEITTTETIRIYDYESFGIGGLTFGSGHPFYFRGI